MPLVIGMTGGIGSGKSAAASMLQELGAAVIDTDAIAHRLTASGGAGSAAIAAAFGGEYVRTDGSLDRERMRALVFKESAAKRKLEEILHPMIRETVRTEVRAVQTPYVVIVVPLLIETGAYRQFAQRVLVIDCSEETQLARVVQRSGITEETARAIMANQVSRAKRLAHADDIVVNESGIEELRASMLALHLKYLQLARTHDAADLREERS